MGLESGSAMGLAVGLDVGVAVGVAVGLAVSLAVEGWLGNVLACGIGRRLGYGRGKWDQPWAWNEDWP